MQIFPVERHDRPVAGNAEMRFRRGQKHVLLGVGQTLPPGFDPRLGLFDRIQRAETAKQRLADGDAVTVGIARFVGNATAIGRTAFVEMIGLGIEFHGGTDRAPGLSDRFVGRHLPRPVGEQLRIAFIGILQRFGERIGPERGAVEEEAEAGGRTQRHGPNRHGT